MTGNMKKKAVVQMINMVPSDENCDGYNESKDISTWKHKGGGA